MPTHRVYLTTYFDITSDDIAANPNFAYNMAAYGTPRDAHDECHWLIHMAKMQPDILLGWWMVHVHEGGVTLDGYGPNILHTGTDGVLDAATRTFSSISLAPPPIDLENLVIRVTAGLNPGELELYKIASRKNAKTVNLEGVILHSGTNLTFEVRDREDYAHVILSLDPV